MEELIRRIDGVCGGPQGAAEPANARELQFKSPRPVLGVRCPQCNKRALRKCKRQSIFERLAALVLFAPYRCRYCRYYEMRFVLEKTKAA